MTKLLHKLDELSDKLLKLICISLLLCVLISAGNALIRKFLGISSNAFLEIQWTLYSLVFLYGGSIVLKTDDHIRIDILYNRYTDKVKKIFNICLHFFITIPILSFFTYYSFIFWLSSFIPFNAQESWEYYLFSDRSYWEWSPNAGGLPTVFAKFLLPSGLALLIIQTLIIITHHIRNLVQYNQ